MINFDIHNLPKIIANMFPNKSGKFKRTQIVYCDVETQIKMDYKFYLNRSLVMRKSSSNSIGMILKYVLRRAFDTLDPKKKGNISVDDLGTILDTLGQHQNEQALRDLVASVDKEGNGTLTFEELCELGAKFMGEEEEDLDKVREELREAFRLYDKEGNGYITTETLREILQELDNNLSYQDLDQIIEEVDADGSGTVDFEGNV
ncbi:hypothetical protein PGB90_005754 [Kerria lacca]